MRTRFFPKIRLESNDLEKEDDKIRVERRAEREKTLPIYYNFFFPKRKIIQNIEGKNREISSNSDSWTIKCTTHNFVVYTAEKGPHKAAPSHENKKANARRNIVQRITSPSAAETRRSSCILNYSVANCNGGRQIPLSILKELSYTVRQYTVDNSLLCSIST